jgi:polar amino acid transport system ATP-binding protein
MQKAKFDQAETIVKVTDLHKYFNGNHVLKGVSFEIKKGMLISIIGRSGCGKTTLLRCLNSLEVLDSGTIEVAGITLSRELKEMPSNDSAKNKKDSRFAGMPFSDFTKHDEVDADFNNKTRIIRQRVGMLFQSLNLFPHLTVLGNLIKAPMIVKKTSKEIATNEALILLEKVGLETFKDRYPNQLSGGQAQRVAIARALAMNPQVMLYDEPTSALDPELIVDVMQVMKQLHDEGMTQIVVTHSMQFAKIASDLIIYMEEGKIVEISTPEEMFTNPKDERTKNYLSILFE